MMEILEYAAGCSLGELNGGERLEDLGIDSLDLLDALIEYGVEVKDIEKIKTVNDLRMILK